MTPQQIRKLNVIIQKKMISLDQIRLLMTLISMPSSTVTDISNIYYGARGEDDKISMRKNYIKKYLKSLILKLEYWGLPYIIVITKDEKVTLAIREGTNKNESLNDRL